MQQAEAATKRYIFKTLHAGSKAREKTFGCSGGFLAPVHMHKTIAKITQIGYSNANSRGTTYDVTHTFARLKVRRSDTSRAARGKRGSQARLLGLPPRPLFQNCTRHRWTRGASPRRGPREGLGVARLRARGTAPAPSRPGARRTRGRRSRPQARRAWRGTWWTPASSSPPYPCARPPRCR